MQGFVRLRAAVVIGVASCGTVGAVACGGPSGPDLTQPASLTLIPAQATLDALGVTLAMAATARDALGNDLPDVALTWESSDQGVVSVDAAGGITAQALGSAEISVTAGELTRTSNITVVQIPAQLDKVSGDQQSGTVGTQLAEPLVLQVNDRNDQPVPDVEVSFEVTAGTAALSMETVTSGADGRVTTLLTLGTVAGPIYQVTASLETGRANRAVFAATGLADAAAAAAAASGDGQRQPAGTTLPNPLRVRVVDQHGNGAPGFAVEFAVDGGGGSVAPSSVDTDEEGFADAVWTLGATVGPQAVSATAAGLDGSPVAFAAEGTDLAISSVTPSPFVEGGTAQIMGTGFDPDPASNAVTVGGLTATVTAASATVLDIDVPRGGCRPEGAVDVVVSTASGGTTPGFAHPLQPDPIVALGVGEQLLLEDPALLCLQFLASAADEEYLLGVQSTSDVAGTLTDVGITSVTAGGPAPMPFVSAMAVSAGTGGQLAETPRMRRWNRHREAEAAFRLRAHEALRGVPLRGRPTVSALAMVDSTVTVGEMVSVRMADLTGNICNESVPVTAIVKAVGLRGIWLADQDNPINGFTDADYQSLSDQLDDVIYDVDVEYFGEPTDVDDNGRILVLVTEKLNDLSNNTLGFVSPADVLDRADCPASNEAEIYYNRAPDPLSGYGREEAMEDAPELVAHELTHIIQAGRRLVNNGVGQMTIFVSEGQATLAEEVVGHAATGRNTLQNYGFTVAFESNPTAWYRDGITDISYYFGRNDGNPGMSVTGAPARCSWLAPSPSPCQGRALWYGVTWSLLRWISDHMGPSYPGLEQGIQRALIDNDQFGFDNIEDVVGEPIETLLADWAAALYLDDRVVGVPARLTIPSWNYKDIFEDGGLPASAALVPAPVPFGEFDIDTRVRAASTSYFLLQGDRSAASIRVRDQADGILPDHMQVFLVRTR